MTRAESDFPSAPLLSICIPTLNRADLLEDALTSLKSEVHGLGGAVEVVVSDDCSSDTTADVLRRNNDWVRWSSSDYTRGFCANVMRLPCDLARGRFVWLVGDDDLVIRGSVTRIVESLKAHPDIAYHYLNFGWLDVEKRHEIIHYANSIPPLVPRKAGSFQCDDYGTRTLRRIEDLVFIPGRNPSALFNWKFCFVAERHLFVTGRERLTNHDSSRGDSSTLLEDHFPHAMITLPQMAGKQIVYIGEPCLLQGIGGWEWEPYNYKNMIHGTRELFTWLMSTQFARDGLAKLWNSYYDMTGRLFFKMLYYPEEHKGLDIVLETAIPAASSNPPFWQSFMEEAGPAMSTDQDARSLVELVTELVDSNPNAKIGLWGVYGRGHRFVKFSPHLHTNLVWVADRQQDLHGIVLDGMDLVISSPESLKSADLDILVLGIRTEFVQEVTDIALSHMRSRSFIVSVKGVTPVEMHSGAL